MVDQPLRNGELHSCLPGASQYVRSNIPTLHVSNDTQAPRILHLNRKPAGAPILAPRPARQTRPDGAGRHEASSIRRVAVAQSCVTVASPGEDPGLGQQAAVHVLPPGAVMLDDGLVGHAEGAAGGVPPVRGLELYRGLLQRLAGAA